VPRFVYFVGLGARLGKAAALAIAPQSKDKADELVAVSKSYVQAALSFLRAFNDHQLKRNATTQAALQTTTYDMLYHFERLLSLVNAALVPPPPPPPPPPVVGASRSPPCSLFSK
jgi:hypothetical protein